jgi:hypothetical protein
VKETASASTKKTMRSVSREPGGSISRDLLPFLTVKPKEDVLFSWIFGQ